MKTIQFKHRNILVHCELDTHNEISAIAVGQEKEPLSPMSRSFAEHKSLALNHLSKIIRSI